jgi:hypothetical protein
MERSDIIRHHVTLLPEGQSDDSPVGRLRLAITSAADTIATLEAKRAEIGRSKHFTAEGKVAREHEQGETALAALKAHDTVVPTTLALAAKLRREALAMGRPSGELSVEAAMIQSEVRTWLRSLSESARMQALNEAIADQDAAVLDAAVAAPRVFGLIHESQRAEVERAQTIAGGSEAANRLNSAELLEGAAERTRQALELAEDTVYSLTNLPRPFNPEQDEPHGTATPAA